MKNLHILLAVLVMLFILSIIYYFFVKKNQSKNLPPGTIDSIILPPNRRSETYPKVLVSN